MKITDHPEYRSLLAAVLATPDDDLPRLVMADWLEEHGEHDRAEFIHVQCELDKCQWQGDLIEPWGRHLIQKEMKLLGANDSDKWFADQSCFELVTDAQVKSGHRFTGGAMSWVIRRGFVAEVHCRLADWFWDVCRNCGGSGRQRWYTGHGNHETHDCLDCSGTDRTVGVGPRLVREHPIRRVVLTNLEPGIDSVHNLEVRWWDAVGWSEPSCLPTVLWGHLIGQESHIGPWRFKKFTTRDAAISALSDALIAWAKSS